MANTILHRLATLLAFCVSVNCVMIKPNVKNIAPNHKETPDKIHSLTLRSTLYRSVLRRIKAILS